MSHPGLRLDSTSYEIHTSILYCSLFTGPCTDYHCRLTPSGWGWTWRFFCICMNEKCEFDFLHMQTFDSQHDTSRFLFFTTYRCNTQVCACGSVSFCVCLTVELLSLLRLHPRQLVLMTRAVFRHLRQKTEKEMIEFLDIRDLVWS